MNKSIKIILTSLFGIMVATAVALFIGGRTGVSVFWHRIFFRPGDKVKEERVQACRGDILAADGSVLVGSTRLFDIHMDCCVLEDEEEWDGKSLALSHEIARLLPDRTAAEWWAYFQQARRSGKRYIPVARNVSWGMRDTLSALPLFREGRYAGGFIAEGRPVRVYPYDSLARRTLGYVKPGDGMPQIGLEGRFNTFLAGSDGTRRVKYGIRKGQPRHWEISLQEPVNGYDLRTTLDMDLQGQCDIALRSSIGDNEDIQGGCLVLMDVETGAVRAMVNLLRTPDGALREYYNFAIGWSYEAGEVISPLAMAAALQDRLIHSLDDVKGLKKASRRAMADVASRYADTPQYFTGWMKALCLPDDMEFDLVGLRNVEIVESPPSGWTEAMLASMGAGYAWTVTPLHLLSFYNTLACKGRMMKPYLVERLESHDGIRVEYGPTLLKEDVLRQEVIAELTSWLKEGVTDGTEPMLKDARYPVAGKTGISRQVLPGRKQADDAGDPYSDELGRHQYAATFAGFFPADTPKYSVVCAVLSNLTFQSESMDSIPVQAVKELLDHFLLSPP